MKAILMRSTALAAVATVAALATPAAAAERLSVKVGGYMDQYVGYTNVEDDSSSSLDVDGVDVQSDRNSLQGLDHPR